VISCEDGVTVFAVDTTRLATTLPYPPKTQKASSTTTTTVASWLNGGERQTNEVAKRGSRKHAPRRGQLSCNRLRRLAALWISIYRLEQVYQPTRVKAFLPDPVAAWQLSSGSRAWAASGAVRTAPAAATLAMSCCETCRHLQNRKALAALDQGCQIQSPKSTPSSILNSQPKSLKNPIPLAWSIRDPGPWA